MGDDGTDSPHVRVNRFVVASEGLTPRCPTIAGMATAGRGLFVAFEGGDGAGKTTQVRLLADALRRAGLDVLETRQPGGTDLGVQLRNLVLHGDHVSPRAEALLYATDKAHHVDTVIAPALDKGRVVITDRYIDSAIAYQGAGRDLGSQEVADIQLWAVAGLVPHLTVVLDVPAGTGRSRRGDVHDRLEAEGDDFHEAVRAHFRALAEAEPERYLVVDATLPPDGDPRPGPRPPPRVGAGRGGDIVSVWDDVVGQPDAVATLTRAVTDSTAMTHAWLFTGPPGSGRSVAARAFAAALECPDDGCGVCRECRTALDGTHADVTVKATEGLSDPGRGHPGAGPGGGAAALGRTVAGHHRRGRRPPHRAGGGRAPQGA